MHPFVARLAAGPQVLADAAGAELDGLSSEDLIEATRLTQAIIRNAQALSAALVAAADRAHAHRAAGATSMSALIAREAGVSYAEAGRQVRLAQQLQTAPATKAAMTTAGMSPAKASLITGALDDLPPDLTADQRTMIETSLVAAAGTMSLEQFRRKTRRAIEDIDTARADQIENTQLERDEERQRRLVRFWISRPDEHGLVSFGGTIDALSGDLLRAAVDALGAPRRQPSADPTEKSAPEARPDTAHRLGQAFVDLIRHLPTDHFGEHGGVPATLMVTVDERVLRGELDRAGLTEYGTTISASALRRLACNAEILPAVMGGASAPLDIGRTGRDHTRAQRRALALRDHGCTYPGCDHPPKYCESHHIHWWSRGGGTSVENGALLCSRHHHHVHQYDIPIRIGPGGLPEFQLHGTWQHNSRYRPVAV